MKLPPLNIPPRFRKYIDLLIVILQLIVIIISIFA